MGTAVLQPQDCLASRHSCQDCHFLPASECPSSVTRSSRRGSSAHSKASSFATDCARGGSSGGTIFAEGRGLLGRKNSSAGLLPLPDQALRSIHPSFHPNISSCRFGEIIDPYASRQFASFLGSRLGPDGADSGLSRCPSMSSLDQQTPTTPRGFSDCSTMLVERAHVSRLRGRNQCVATAHRNCMLGSWSCVEGVAPSYQNPKPWPNPHQFDVNDAVVPNGVNSTNWSNQVKGIISPEFVHLDRQSLKPPCKALPDAQGKPTFKVISTVGRKHGVSRQLKRCMSEKFQERTKMSIVQRPNSKEAARELITNIFQEVDKYKSSDCPASLVEGKKEGIQGEFSLDLGHQESCRKLDSSRWLSLNTDEKWAGPSFFNSPAPNALPVPSFTSRLSRVTSICSVPAVPVDCSTQIVLGNSFPEPSLMRDVTFATKDLRRILNLNG